MFIIAVHFDVVIDYSNYDVNKRKWFTVEFHGELYVANDIVEYYFEIERLSMFSFQSIKQSSSFVFQFSFSNEMRYRVLL